MTLSHRLPRVVGLALSALASLAPAVPDNGGAAAPFEPQINNIADNFEFQATGVTDVTWTFTYTWSNSGTAASINQSTTVAAGAAVVTVYDAVGTQVYSQSLSANGTFPTSVGVAGNWTIKVVFTTYDGTVNFRAQKA
jgi:hypothetical protein